MKKTSSYVVIGIGWLLIFWYWIHPVEIIDWLSIIFFSGALSFLVVKMILLPLVFLIFKYRSGKYFIKKGKHYASRIHPFFPNFGLFFFKREMTVLVKVDRRAWQIEPPQWNKIVGFGSIIYRFNSVRAAWKRGYKSGTMEYSSYRRWRGEIVVDEIGGLYKMNGYQKITLRSPRLIWIGVFHYPYHGGKEATKNTYDVDVRVLSFR